MADLLTHPHKKKTLTAQTGNRSPASGPSLLDPSLLVASISPSHLAFLSTEALCDDQLLIATRTNEDNRAQLTQKDCEALLIGLTEIDGLAWYDAGPAAGARALHKHFHLIPLTGNELSPLPLDPLLQNARTDQPIWSVPGLPFRHACAPMDPDWTNPEKDCGASVHACYRALMRTVGLPVQASTGSHAATGAYNLLATRKWLLLIPRAHDCVAGIPVQAPAFAGIFAVKTAAQLAALRRHSPLAVLQQAACPLREE